MNLLKAKRVLAKLIPKKLKRPSLIQRRKEIKSIKLKILNAEFKSLSLIEDAVRTKGKTSKEVSVLKSMAAMDFSEKYFGIKLDKKQQETVSELMARVEERERAVKAFKRNPLNDETTSRLKKELSSVFLNQDNYLKFLATYKIYSAELKQLLKEAGY